MPHSRAILFSSSGALRSKRALAPPPTVYFSSSRANSVHPADFLTDFFTSNSSTRPGQVFQIPVFYFYFNAANFRKLAEKNLWWLFSASAGLFKIEKIFL